MLPRFELWYPAKPYIVTQAWGIYNPAYQQFGFSKHNGIDFILGDDKNIYSPCELVITWVGYEPGGAGNYVIGVTPVQSSFDDGKEGAVEVTFMHMETVTVRPGDHMYTGDSLGIADNTGFSTGPHTHMRCRRVTEDGTHIDVNDANDSFDHSPYFNGSYAQLGKLASLTIKLAELIVQLFAKKNP